jgi:iron complex transport system substrate-binding protein
VAARHARLIVLRLAVALVIATSVVPSSSPVASSSALQRQAATAPPARIVSLVPALTEILFAIGAGGRVAGVSSFDTFPPEVERLPRVGALLDPDTERILALRPDLVVVYASQGDLQARFRAAGIGVFVYQHGGIQNVLETIRQLGALTRQESDADRLVRELQSRMNAIRARVAGRPRPRTLLVIEREAGTLRGIYASGGSGFLAEMLDIAGGSNAFASVRRESVQPSIETLLQVAPEVIVEIRAGQEASSAVNPQELVKVWSRLGSVPAVRNGRLHLLTGQHLVVPGPRLVDGIESLATALHP